MGNRWYVVKTKSHHEEKVLKIMRSENYTAFFPKFIRVSENKRTKLKKVTQLPLFPCYVFVEFDITSTKRWQAINNFRGVTSIIGYRDDYVTPIPHGYVEDLISKSDEKDCLPVEDAVKHLFEFKHNMQLQIEGTSYDGLIGTYCEHSDERVVLLLTLLSRPVRVSLPIEAVRPVVKTNTRERRQLVKTK